MSNGTGWGDRYGGAIGDPFAISVYTDPTLPAGTAELDISDDDHITGIRANSLGFELTDEQIAQVRAHYAATSRRAGELLAGWELWRETLVESARARRRNAALQSWLIGELLSAHFPKPDPIFRITGT